MEMPAAAGEIACLRQAGKKQDFIRGDTSFVCSQFSTWYFVHYPIHYSSIGVRYWTLD
jgi:hypothetical protein